MSHEPVDLKNSRVLIVDDTPENLDLLSHFLEKEGYGISCAMSGEDALTIASVDLPDLILLDVMMPGMDGFETCRRLKSVSATRDIPIIFVTGKTETKDIVKGFKLGGVDYLNKPIKQEEVKVRVQTHLQLQVLMRQRDELIAMLRDDKQHDNEVIEAQRQQILQHERLAALGELMREFCHEISTPVGTGLTSLSVQEEQLHVLSKSLEDNTLTRSALDDYVISCSEACTIGTNSLQLAFKLIKSFSRVTSDQCQEQQEVFNLRENMECTLLTLRPKLKKTDHKLTLECPEGLTIDSYPGAFSRIIMNLVKNSLIHAFDEDEVGEIIIQVAESRGKLTLSYSDNGKGIEAEHLKDIFEKYFTTKLTEGGTGLGLYIVHNLVTEVLKGKVDCQSEPGNGVQFEIKMPVIVADES